MTVGCQTDELITNFNVFNGSYPLMNARVHRIFLNYFPEAFENSELFSRLEAVAAEIAKPPVIDSSFCDKLNEL